MNQSTTTESTPPMTPQDTPSLQSPPHNPYQRVASRRAIACVTCAKAKTKCDKNLPCCSRCVTKGIKCEPRSTRRTSENTYRPTLKKTFVTPKRYNSTSALPLLNRHHSPRSMLSSKPRPMRAASHIDFRTAVKMSQQASNLSGLPTLQPLPTYSNQIFSEGTLGSINSEQSPAEFNSAPDTSNLLASGRLTPQTPEAIMYHEPMSMTDLSEQWMAESTWTEDSLATVGLGLECGMSGMMSTDLWPIDESIHTVPMAQMAWSHTQSSISPQSMSSDFAPDSSLIPALSTGAFSVEDFDGSSNLNNGWGNFQFSTCDNNLTSLAASTSFVPDFASYPATMPTWEDVFIPGQAPY